MPIIPCPNCKHHYETASEVDRQLRTLKRGTSSSSLKVACPGCGQWVRLPGIVPVSTPNAPRELLRSVIAQSRMLDDDEAASLGTRRSDPRTGDDDDETGRPTRSQRRTRKRSRPGHGYARVIGITAGSIIFGLTTAAILYFVVIQSVPGNALEANDRIILVDQPDSSENDEPNDAGKGKQTETKLTKYRNSVRTAHKRINRPDEYIINILDFFIFLHEGESSKAYALLSDQMKGKYPTLASFETFVSQNPALLEVSIPFRENDESDLNTPTMTYLYYSFINSKRYQYSIIMIAVGSTWRVDRITMIPK